MLRNIPSKFIVEDRKAKCGSISGAFFKGLRELQRPLNLSGESVPLNLAKEENSWQEVERDIRVSKVIGHLEPNCRTPGTPSRSLARPLEPCFAKSDKSDKVQFRENVSI